MEFFADLSAWQMRVGARVAAIRRTQGLTRAAFGARLGITAGMVGKIERGQALLTVPHALQIRQAFGISLDALYDNATYTPEEVEVLILIRRLSADAREKLRRILEILTFLPGGMAAPEEPPPDRTY